MMTDSNWEALAEIYLRCGDSSTDDRDYTLCLCSRVLVKNHNEAVAIEQEELSEAYDVFNEQYCVENHVPTMNRIPKDAQEEEDSDANSCYYSASASHTDNYCTTDEHERDSGADISEYHALASTSRERFRRTHRDDTSKSSTSGERERNNSLPEIFEDEKELSESWEKYWSQNGERLIWSSWIEKYSDFMSTNPNFNDEQEELDGKDDEIQSSTNDEPVQSVNEGNETAIVVCTCSPGASSIAINEEAMNSDGAFKDMMDSLAIPRCDSVSSSIPLTIGTTDSMTNVTQITLSSYGFCSSRITSETSDTPSSHSPPSNFEDGEETKIELINDEDTFDQQWQVLWQEHFQEQYTINYHKFIDEHKPLKTFSLSKSFHQDEKPSLFSDPPKNDDMEYEFDNLEIQKMSEMGLPTSFGNKFGKSQFKHTSPKPSEEIPITDRVKAAFTLMGYAFQNMDLPQNATATTNGHVVYRKRNIRLHNNMLKLKKKRIDIDNTVRDEALLSIIADTSSDEAETPMPNLNLIKLDSIDASTKDIPDIVKTEINQFCSENSTKNPSGLTLDDKQSKNTKGEATLKYEAVVNTKIEENAQITQDETIVTGAIAKSNSKKSKKKRRQNKLLAGLPAEIANDRTLYKYWCKRFSLFSLFDAGIKLDRESWFSVTPEKVAIYTASRCQCDVLIDAFCGAGGNTIQFAKTCKRVIAIDIDAKKIEMAKHNASIYGVSDRIEFIVGDYFQLADKLEADVVFLSPPWGGPQYLKEDVYDIEKSLLPVSASELMRITRKITSSIAIYLPRNSNTHQLAMLAGPGNSVEVEQGFLDRKLIAITAFYGNLLKNTQQQQK